MWQGGSITRGSASLQEWPIPILLFLGQASTIIPHLRLGWKLNRDPPPTVKSHLDPPFWGVPWDPPKTRKKRLRSPFLMVLGPKTSKNGRFLPFWPPGGRFWPPEGFLTPLKTNIHWYRRGRGAQKWPQKVPFLAPRRAKKCQKMAKIASGGGPRDPILDPFWGTQKTNIHWYRRRWGSKNGPGGPFLKKWGGPRF